MSGGQEAITRARRAHSNRTRARRRAPGTLALGLCLCLLTPWLACELAAKPAAKLRLKSPAFAAGKAIPKKYAYKGEGQNISPPLTWSGAPKSTRSFALVVDDPDAPSPKKPRKKPWVHWVLYNIPAGRSELPEGKSGGGTSGKNDFGTRAWGGPMPPRGSGTHRYFFKLYALDKKLSIGPEATKQKLLAAMKGHVVARGKMYGTYTRR